MASRRLCCRIQKEAAVWIASQFLMAFCTLKLIFHNVVHLKSSQATKGHILHSKAMQTTRHERRPGNFDANCFIHLCRAMFESAFHGKATFSSLLLTNMSEVMLMSCQPPIVNIKFLLMTTLHWMLFKHSNIPYTGYIVQLLPGSDMKMNGLACPVLQPIGTC